ncbi:hypothetical protein ACIOZL_19705 [Streptomyces sp. NPDC087769]|uniref:hypothetical protein n=1 Tax=Streptomyces sp. NPDC087769 TaxID=3365802 RepID=UPI003803F333
MTTELVRHQPAGPASLPDKMQYAKALAASGMLPSQYRNQPANLLYALEFADSLGLHPMAAITGVHVIEGKPSASSALISALVRRAGHKLRVTGDDTRAVAQIVRADDPGFTFECVWTMDRAQQAGLTGKKVWKQYPAAMLKARAITEVAREACEEALSGMHYTPEELGANVNEDGLPVDAEVQQLRRVQPGEADRWVTPSATVQAGIADVPPESLTPSGRDYLHEALAAPDAATVRLIWTDAKAEGARPEYLEQITAVGKEKVAAPVSTAEPAPAADDVVDAEVLSPEDDYAAAVAELRAVADAVGLEDFEAGTEQALGMPLADAPAAAIRALAAQIRPAAA